MGDRDPRFVGVSSGVRDGGVATEDIEDTIDAENSSEGCNETTESATEEGFDELSPTSLDGRTGEAAE